MRQAHPRAIPTLALGFFVAMGIWPMLLVSQAPSSLIPGLHLGDNVAALWNTWWFAYAVDHGLPVYRTGMLFAPVGTQLSLHTHTTAHSLLGWPLAAGGATVAGHNVALAVGLVLNGFCSWLLAARLTGAPVASLAAGLIFSLSAYVQIHALGHVNLLHAWVLPLFALLLVRLPTAGLAATVGCGVAAALVVYTDYYYAVYAAIFASAWYARERWHVDLRPGVARAPRFRTILLALLLIDTVVILTIAATGGATLDLGFTRVSVRGLRNPLTAFWVLLATWGIMRRPFAISVGRRAETRLRVRTLLTAVVTAIVLTAPLWSALGRVLASGEYATQRVLWRSSPAGVDVATLVLGHPRHLLWGEVAAGAYEALGIDVMEQSLYPGWLALAVIVARRRSWIGDADARFWLGIGIVFLVLSLGPFLRVAGADTGMPLPHSVLRYLPVFSNARIPGRAVVMVQLAVAVLAAFALAGLDRRRLVLTIVAVSLALETLPARLPVQRVPQPDAVDAALASSPAPGAVAELPLGLRDGFGETGRLDHRALAHQLWHGRPLVGGFVARLPERVRHAQLASPPIAALLKLSTGEAAPGALDPGFAAAAAAAGIGFVVINRDALGSAALPRPALEAAGLALLASDGPRQVYATAGRAR